MSSRYLLSGIVPLTKSPFINKKHRTPRPTVKRGAFALSVCLMTEGETERKVDRQIRNSNKGRGGEGQNGGKS